MELPKIISITFNLNQAGIVSNIMSNNRTTGLITFNFGYSFNKTNNLYQSVIIHGINNESSMADYWAGISEGSTTRMNLAIMFLTQQLHLMPG